MIVHITVQIVSVDRIKPFIKRIVKSVASMDRKILPQDRGKMANGKKFSQLLDLRLVSHAHSSGI